MVMARNGCIRGLNLQLKTYQSTLLCEEYLVQCRLKIPPVLFPASLRDALLHVGSLRDASLRVASLRYAFLRVGFMRDASLHDASLRDASLRYALCVLSFSG